MQFTYPEVNTIDFNKWLSLISPSLYSGAGMNVPYWDFLGSTMVTNNYVRLVRNL